MKAKNAFDIIHTRKHSEKPKSCIMIVHLLNKHCTDMKYDKNQHCYFLIPMTLSENKKKFISIYSTQVRP